MKFLTALFALVALCLATTAFADINVSGEGSVTLTPDTACVSLAVVTESKSASVALDDNNTAMTALYATLKQFGLPKDDIRTDSFAVQPNYDYSNNTTRLTGYSVVNQVTITLNDLDKLPKLLPAVTEQGCNRIGGLSFTNRNSEKAMDVARIKAIRDARHKADLLAATAGVRVGIAIDISESSSVNRPIYRGGPQMAAPGGGSDHSATPVSGGQLTVNVNVSVRYAIEPLRANKGPVYPSSPTNEYSE